jgi:hypothetical protein
VIDELVNDAFTPWGMGTARTTADLLEIYEALTGRPLDRRKRRWERGEEGWRERRDAMRRVLFDALEAGWLVCEAVAPIFASVPFVAEDDLEPGPEPVVQEVETSDWIAVVLRDDEGRPVANARCIITPAGSLPVEAVTSDDGRVLLRGLARGPCTIEFPDFDRSALT